MAVYTASATRVAYVCKYQWDSLGSLVYITRRLHPHRLRVDVQYYRVCRADHRPLPYYSYWDQLESEEYVLTALSEEEVDLLIAEGLLRSLT